jgi:hypothetical protein
VCLSVFAGKAIFKVGIYYIYRFDRLLNGCPYNYPAGLEIARQELQRADKLVNSDYAYHV